MKKIFAFAIGAALLCFAAGCAEEDVPCTHEWDNGTCTLCGEVCEHSWEDNACTLCGMHEYEDKSVPVKFREDDCPEQGTVVSETISYGEEEFGAYVYLPYGYDKAAETDYDILYLLHGANENEGYWFKQGYDYVKFSENFTVAMLDNLIYYGMCDPVIIVTPGTYDILASDGAYFREALIPAIETKYNTYANGDVSDANLIATRDHRAMAGFSMGGMTTYTVGLQQNLDIIGWFGCYTGSGDAQSLLNVLSSEENKDYHINFFYNGQGTLDLAELRAAQLEMADDLLADGRYFTEGENFILNDKENKGHTYATWIIDLYNCLTVSFFR